MGGFEPVDDRTVLLRFDPPDPSNLARLCTSRLLPAALKLGPYVVKSENGQTVVLSANQHFPGPKGALVSCTIRLGGDATPLVSFSLNRYDAVTLFSQRDLDFARRKAMDQAVLLTFSQDRYFLSCGLDNPSQRLAIRNALDPRDILANFVKADGAVISAIESDAAAASPAPVADKLPALAPQPISVLFRSDDPVSAIIAEKVVADLTRSGQVSSLRAATQEEYEVSLVRRDFGVAVGWAPSDVTIDESEKLRLRSMWFPGATDETARISDNREIPLFSVKKYLLCKKKVGFAGQGLAGIFLSE